MSSCKTSLAARAASSVAPAVKTPASVAGDRWISVAVAIFEKGPRWVNEMYETRREGGSSVEGPARGGDGVDFARRGIGEVEIAWEARLRSNIEREGSE